jgi:hypothetical protein
LAGGFFICHAASRWSGRNSSRDRIATCFAALHNTVVLVFFLSRLAETDCGHVRLGFVRPNHHPKDRFPCLFA